MSKQNIINSFRNMASPEFKENMFTQKVADIFKNYLLHLINTENIETEAELPKADRGNMYEPNIFSYLDLVRTPVKDNTFLVISARINVLGHIFIRAGFHEEVVIQKDAAEPERRGVRNSVKDFDRYYGDSPDMMRLKPEDTQSEEYRLEFSTLESKVMMYQKGETNSHQSFNNRRRVSLMELLLGDTPLMDEIRGNGYKLFVTPENIYEGPTVEFALL